MNKFLILPLLFAATLAHAAVTGGVGNGNGGGNGGLSNAYAFNSSQFNTLNNTNISGKSGAMWTNIILKGNVVVWGDINGLTSNQIATVWGLVNSKANSTNPVFTSSLHLTAEGNNDAWFWKYPDAQTLNFYAGAVNSSDGGWMSQWEHNGLDEDVTNRFSSAVTIELPTKTYYGGSLLSSLSGGAGGGVPTFDGVATNLTDWDDLIRKTDSGNVTDTYTIANTDVLYHEVGTWGIAYSWGNDFSSAFAITNDGVGNISTYLKSSGNGSVFINSTPITPLTLQSNGSAATGVIGATGISFNGGTDVAITISSNNNVGLITSTFADGRTGAGAIVGSNNPSIRFLKPVGLTASKALILDAGGTVTNASGTADATTFLRGDGAYATPGGSGTMTSVNTNGTAVGINLSSITFSNSPDATFTGNSNSAVGAISMTIPNTSGTGNIPRTNGPTINNLTMLGTANGAAINISGQAAAGTIIATNSVATATANIATAANAGAATVTNGATMLGTLTSSGTNVIAGAFVRVPTKSGNGTFTVTGSSYGTIATNASFTMTLSGGASNGQYFCLAISNYNSSSITLTSSPALMEPSVGSTNLFTILPGVTIWDLIYKTNFVGSGAWHIRGEPGYVLAAGANVTFTTNGLTITIASSGGSGSLATNANQFGAQVTLTIADSALLTNTVIFGQAKIVSAYVTNVLTASNILSTAWASMVTNNISGWQFVMGTTVTNTLTASNLTSTAWLNAPTSQISGWSFSAGLTGTNTVQGSNLTSTAWLRAPTNQIGGWSFEAGVTVTNTAQASNVTATAFLISPTNMVSGWLFASGATFTNTVTGSNFVATAGGTNVFGATQITNAAGVPLIVRGPGGSNAAVGGLIYVSTALYTNLGTAPATLTNMGAVTIAGHTLTNTGDSIVAEWDVKMLAAAASTNQFKVVFGSATVLDTGLITGSNGVVHIRSRFTRTGNTAQHVYTELRTFAPIAGAMVSTNANVEITETNGINTTLALQGASRIAGASTNNLFRVWYEPATY